MINNKSSGTKEIYISEWNYVIICNEVGAKK